ncbi:MAG: hypothetical protein K1X50_16410 [Candidatus Promineofilum sp.]|nr:hypothetical protein [Promineifilum sp.]MCW5863364.1 hypothetical protein [Anaerolineae bacterium]
MLGEGLLAMFKSHSILVALFVLLLMGCGSGQSDGTPDFQRMIRYGYQTSRCHGYTDSSLFYHVRGYSIPLFPGDADMEAAWHENSQAIILRDRRANLHRISLSEPVQIVDFDAGVTGGSGLSLSKRYPLAAFWVYLGQAGTWIHIQDFSDSGSAITLKELPQLGQPALHPGERVVAGLIYSETPDGSRTSNVVGVFELLDDGAKPRATFELEPNEILKVFGWSAGGEVIAVAQTEKRGVIPFYIFTESGQIKRSQLGMGCALSTDWSPLETRLLYSATNDTDVDDAGRDWDLYMETMGPRPEDAFSLQQLTDTSTADEIAAVWSGDGRSIAYARASADETEALWQDLFAIYMDDPTYTPQRLTATADEYETNPMWLSDNEIAYLSWASNENTWYLKRLVINELGATPTTVLKLPESWYQAYVPTTEQ